MTRPRTSDVRKAIPASVKVAVLERELLRARGEEGPIQYDHDPALGLREWDEAAGDFKPAQLDPAYIVPRAKAAHRTKSGGRRGEKRSTSYGSDAHAIAKLDRLTPAQTEFQRRVLQRECGEKRERTGNWPQGRKIRSRGFEQRRRPQPKHGEK